MKRLMVSPLTGKIYLTAVKEMKDGLFLATGQKQDYTNEAIRAVYEWFMQQAKASNDGFYQIQYGDKPWLTMHIEQEAANDQH